MGLKIRDIKCDTPSSMKYNKYYNKYNKVKALSNAYLELDAWMYEEVRQQQWNEKHNTEQYKQYKVWERILKWKCP